VDSGLCAKCNWQAALWGRQLTVLMCFAFDDKETSFATT
jgi:hypothetical protein